MYDTIKKNIFTVKIGVVGILYYFEVTTKGSDLFNQI